MYLEVAPGADVKCDRQLSHANGDGAVTDLAQVTPSTKQTYQFKTLFLYQAGKYQITQFARKSHVLRKGCPHHFMFFWWWGGGGLNINIWSKLYPLLGPNVIMWRKCYHMGANIQIQEQMLSCWTKRCHVKQRCHVGRSVLG